MIEINLLPDVKQEFLRARQTRNSVISISIIAGLASIALVVVLAMVLAGQTAVDSFASNRINDEYEKLSSVDDLSEMVTIKEQLGSIDAQHASKTMTSRMFSVLQIINPSGGNSVQFSSVGLVPAEHTLRLEGLTTNGYPAVEALKKTIENTQIEFMRDDERISEPLATRVSVGETSLAEDAEGRRVVRFEVTIASNEVLFSNQAKDMRIRGPSGRIDVTDSRVGIPESLFTAAPREDDDE